MPSPADPHFNGWYVQGAWVLTGEPRPYNAAEARFDAPKMAYNFNPAAGTYGTIELVARYSDLDLNFHDCGAGHAIPTTAGAACFDAIRGGEQKISSVGINWYLNPDIRFMLDYQHVDVDRLNNAGVQVGQTYNALTLRSQLTFYHLLRPFGRPPGEADRGGPRDKQSPAVWVGAPLSGGTAAPRCRGFLSFRSGEVSPEATEGASTQNVG